MEEKLDYRKRHYPIFSTYSNIRGTEQYDGKQQQFPPDIYKKGNQVNVTIAISINGSRNRVNGTHKSV